MMIEADLFAVCKPALLLSYSVWLFFVIRYACDAAKVFTRDSRLE